MQRYSAKGKITAGPAYLLYGLLMASFVLVRLIKNPILAHYIDIDESNALLLRGINLIQRMSLESNDTAARMALVLNDLRNSDKAFRDADITKRPPALRVRSRLVMNHALDAMLWWKEEFGGSASLYPGHAADPPCSDIGLQASMADMVNRRLDTIHGGSNGVYHSPLPTDSILTEFGLMVDDGLFSSIWGPFAQLTGDSMI